MAHKKAPEKEAAVKPRPV